MNRRHSLVLRCVWMAVALVCAAQMADGVSGSSAAREQMRHSLSVSHHPRLHFMTEIDFKPKSHEFTVFDNKEQAHRFPDAWKKHNDKLQEAGLGREPAPVIIVAAHGSDKLHRELGENRARSVACFIHTWLQRQGIPRQTLQVGVVEGKPSHKVHIFFPQHARADNFRPTFTWRAGAKDDGGLYSYCGPVNHWKSPDFDEEWVAYSAGFDVRNYPIRPGFLGDGEPGRTVIIERNFPNAPESFLNGTPTPTSHAARYQDLRTRWIKQAQDAAAAMQQNALQVRQLLAGYNMDVLDADPVADEKRRLEEDKLLVEYEPPSVGSAADQLQKEEEAPGRHGAAGRMMVAHSPEPELQAAKERFDTLKEEVEQARGVIQSDLSKVLGTVKEQSPELAAALKEAGKSALKVLQRELEAAAVRYHKLSPRVEGVADAAGGIIHTEARALAGAGAQVVPKAAHAVEVASADAGRVVKRGADALGDYVGPRGQKVAHEVATGAKKLGHALETNVPPLAHNVVHSVKRAVAHTLAKLKHLKHHKAHHSSSASGSEHSNSHSSDSESSNSK